MTQCPLSLTLSDVCACVPCTGVPLLFYGLLYRRRGDIQSLGLALQLESERTGIVTIASDLSQPTNQQQRSRSTGNLQRRPSIMGKTESLTYLVQLFENFLPSRYYMGVWLLLLRLAQTSLMTVFDSQLAQAAVMGCVTLGAAAALRELSPYRRPSDNHSALLGQWLVFAWVFVMLLRLAGLFQSGFAALAIGVLLCALTLAVFVTAVVMANNDRNAEAHAGDVAANAQHSDGDAEAASSDATANARVAEEGDAQREGGALEAAGGSQSVVAGCSSSYDARAAATHEEGPNSPPAESGEGGPSAWLARVVGGHLCMEDPQQEAL